MSRTTRRNGQAAKAEQSREDPTISKEDRYLQMADGLYRIKWLKDGPVLSRLTNFKAKIVGDLLLDDGVGTTRQFEIEATIKGQSNRFMVPAAEFAELRWVAEQVGAEAVMLPGNLARDHVRAGIQLDSGDIAQSVVYAHTGWRMIGGQYYFLHGGGAIGPDPAVLVGNRAEDRTSHNSPCEEMLHPAGPVGPVGPVLQTTHQHVRVELPSELADFELPPPDPNLEIQTAIRRTLRFLRLLPARVSFPLFATPWTAALSLTDLGVHLVGGTGLHKTCVAALLQQFFAPAAEYKNLPASWESTSNYLNTLASYLKDCLLVVDDFAPDGSEGDVQRLHSRAARLARSAANRSQRGRCRSNGSLAESRRPRALIVYTGEDVPWGRSVRARLLILEMGKGDTDSEPLAVVDKTILTRCQQEARAGVYAQAMAGYIRWLAPQWPNLQAEIEASLDDFRVKFAAPERHPQTTDILCKLGVGFDNFLCYAHSVGAISDSEQLDLWDRFHDAAFGVAKKQVFLQQSTDPVELFLDLLSALLSTGRAYVADYSGKAPDDDPDACGWERYTTIVGEGEEEKEVTTWRHRGSHIGWYNGTALLLQTKVAIAEAQKLAREIGQAITVTEKTLGKMLDERNMLLSTDKENGHYAKRLSINGGRTRVLHIAACHVIKHPLTTDPPSNEELMAWVNA